MTLPASDYAPYLILALLTAAWCVLHSALISVRLTDALKRRHPGRYRYYRLFYNAVAVITLAPLLLYALALRGEPLFAWQGPWRIVQALMIGTGLLLFLLGTRKYDARRFLGLAQLREDTAASGITASGGLDTSGILGVVRHPWYSGLLLVLWARPLDLSTLVINTVFTLYLLIGIRLEEAKLVREFGDRYRHYQQTVSMLVPVKWLLARMRGRAG